MASTTVTAGNQESGQITLVASTVDTVTFADTIYAVEVESDGAARLNFTTDGTTPTVNGQHGYELPAVASARVELAEGSVIKLISAGTPAYNVTRVAASRAH